MRVIFVTALILSAVTACAYETAFRDCLVRCAADEACPDGMTCGPGGVCGGNHATCDAVPDAPDAMASSPDTAQVCMNFEDPIIDLAHDRPAHADKAAQLHGADKANDNDDATSWNAGDAVPGHWWRVDLGEQRLLTSLNTLWEYEGVQHYRYEVSVSSDGINFSTVIDQTADTRVTKSRTDTFPSATCARYVRLTKTDNTGYWALLFTVNVMGR